MSSEIKTSENVLTEFKPPSSWKVIFLNDNKTPMDFVIELLSTLFKHDTKTAKDITLEIHNSGRGIAGIYPFEIAEHKAIEATNLARSHSFPLKIQIEEE